MVTFMDKVPPRNTGPARRKRYAWAERLEPARRRPGVWCLLDDDWSQSVAGQIRDGRLKGVERGDFETRRRKQPNGRYHVYVRYVGKASEAKTRPEHEGWTKKRLREANLPARANQETGLFEYQLPREGGWAERWVNPDVLPDE